MRSLGRLLEQCVKEWNADNAPSLSAALAFYTLLSLSPIVIVIVSLAGLVFGQEAAEGQLAWEIHDVVGWDGAQAIQAIIHSAHQQHAGIVAAVVSILALVFGASSVVVELRSSLNAIWQLSDDNPSGVKALVKVCQERFYSIALVMAAGILLLISVAASAWISALGRFLGPHLRFPEGKLHWAAFVVSYVVITLLFAAIYRLVPDVKLEWADVMIGASVTSLIFTAGKQLIGLYLGRAAFASTYGAAGSFLVLFVWVYYSAQLFFLGAEFTKVYARMCGSHSGSGSHNRTSFPAAAARPETK